MSARSGRRHAHDWQARPPPQSVRGPRRARRPPQQQTHPPALAVTAHRRAQGDNQTVRTAITPPRQRSSELSDWRLHEQAELSGNPGSRVRGLSSRPDLSRRSARFCCRFQTGIFVPAAPAFLCAVDVSDRPHLVCCSGCLCTSLPRWLAATWRDRAQAQRL